MKNRIVRWLKSQVRQAKAKGVVFGLSGGVDSAVVAALAKEALGRQKVLALIMPIHSQPQDERDARLLARKLGIRVRRIDLSPVYDSLRRALPAAKSMAYANLKPRLRMVTLYYFANQLNYLVCGTGNKSEIMVGYTTKHGDSAADLLPIAGLFKKDVRILARQLFIPQGIIDKPPTAGLWPGQTDEGEMGLTYQELDSILEGICSGRRPAATKAKVVKVKGMIAASAHKRRSANICVI